MIIDDDLYEQIDRAASQRYKDAKEAMSRGDRLEALRLLEQAIGVMHVLAGLAALDADRQNLADYADRRREFLAARRSTVLDYIEGG